MEVPICSLRIHHSALLKKHCLQREENREVDYVTAASLSYSLKLSFIFSPHCYRFIVANICHLNTKQCKKKIQIGKLVVGKFSN